MKANQLVFVLPWKHEHLNSPDLFGEGIFETFDKVIDICLYPPINNLNTILTYRNLKRGAKGYVDDALQK